MATEGTDTSGSGAEMFDAAFAQPEPQTTQTETPAAETQPAEPAQTDGERARDDKGRFAPKADDPPGQEPAQAQPAQQQQADHRIPLAEHLSVRERAQAAERERDTFRQQAEAFQRQLAQLQQQNAPKPEAPPDIFENPQGFVGHMQSQFDQRFRQQAVNFSLQLAHREHKQEFEQAYQSAIEARQMGDPGIDAILASGDPGESLMRWHRSRVLLEKTGGNLDAYLQSQFDAKLKDPAFLAKAIEAARSQQQPGQQSPVVELPPSLTRTPGGSATNNADSRTPTGQELFDSAFAR